MIPDAANMRVRNTVALCNFYQGSYRTSPLVMLRMISGFNFVATAHRTCQAAVPCCMLSEVFSFGVPQARFVFAVVQRVAIQMAGDMSVR